MCVLLLHPTAWLESCNRLLLKDQKTKQVTNNCCCSALVWTSVRLDFHLRIRLLWRKRKNYNRHHTYFILFYSYHANVRMPKGELGLCGHWALVQANESLLYLMEYKDIQMLIWFRPECKFPYYYPNVFLWRRLYSRWLLFYTLLCNNMLHVIKRRFFNLSFYTRVEKIIHAELNVTIHSKGKQKQRRCFAYSLTPLC